MAKNWYYIVFFCLVWLSFGKQALSEPWHLSDEGLLSEEQLIELREQFPSIKAYQDATSLLDEISNLRPLNRIELFKTDAGLKVKAQAAKTIRRIRISTLTRQLRRDLQTKSSGYHGQVDSQEIQNRLRRDYQEVLKSQGYFLSQITIQKQTSGQHQVDYLVQVEENDPCLIREVRFGFQLPDDVRFRLSLGDICDQSVLAKATDRLETQLRRRGYNQFKILPPEVRFDEGSNSALIFVPGSIGRKITYDIDSPIRNPRIISFLFGDELNTLDPSITAPDSMRTEILRKYRSRGFDDVIVEGPTVSQPNERTTRYHFVVAPGPEYRITEIQIEGLTVFTQEEAIETMGLYPRLGNAPLLTQDMIREAIDSLTSRYNQLGYWDSRISFPRITKNQSNGETKLVFLINEGKRRVLDGLILQGFVAFDQKTVQSWFPVQEKSAIIWSDLVDFERRIRDEYRGKGYLYSKIDIELLQNNRFRDIATRVVVSIDEGPQVRIGNIVVEGLARTKRHVVLRELRFSEGDVYSPELIEESRQALIDLGLFSSVSIRPLDTTDITNENEVIDYLVLATDARPGTVVFGPGWSLNEGGRFSIDTSYSNLNGEGRQIFLRTAINEEKDQVPIGTKTLLGRNIGVGMLEPYLFDFPVNGTITLNHRAEADSTQWKISRSIEGILSHRYRISGPKQKSEAFSIHRTTRIEAEQSLCALILVCQGDVQIRELGLRHQIEARNNISWPTQGYVFQAEAAWADYYLGGDTRYFRWSLRHSAYRELYENFVLALGLTYDSYQNIERRGDLANILPSSELVKSGGANTNRGFRENELGPVVRFRTEPDAPATTRFPGGSQRFSLKSEVRYQVIEDAMAISFFVDSGNSFFSRKEEAIIRDQISGNAEIYDNQPYNLEDILLNPKILWEKNYLSYGISLSYLTPLGSINLSYGFPWKRCLTDEQCVEPRGNDNFNRLLGGQLHISVGANF